MKRKDLIYLAVSIVILLVAGYLAYTQLFPQTANKDTKVMVEVVDAVPGNFNATDLGLITDGTRVRNFSSPLDLTGLNNQNLFGQ